MKGKLKFVLMSLVLIPCLLLLTACNVKANTYAEKASKTAEKYYFNHGEMQLEDIKYTLESKSEYTYSDSVEITDSVSETADFSTVTESTQIVEVDSMKNADGSSTVYVRVTKESEKNEKGYKANEAQTALEEYTKVIVTKEVATFVKDGENFKYFEEYTKSVDGAVVEEDSYKKFHTFADAGSYNTALNSVMEEVNEDLVNEVFFGSYTEYMAIGDGKYYSNFGNFGVKINATMTGLNTSEYAYRANSFSFKNKMSKSKIKSAEYSAVSTNTKDGTMTDLERKSNSKLKVSYKSVEIGVPTGFTDDKAAVITTYVNIDSFMDL